MRRTHQNEPGAWYRFPAIRVQDGRDLGADPRQWPRLPHHLPPEQLHHLGRLVDIVGADGDLRVARVDVQISASRVVQLIEMQAIHISYLGIRVPLGVLGDAVVVGQLKDCILLFRAVPHHGHRILQKHFSVITRLGMH